MVKNTKPKILIFGGSGQIGSRTKILLAKRYQIIAPTHDQVDIINKQRVENFINHHRPNQILYSAGVTGIDKAPEQPKEAFVLNAGAIYYISSLAQKLNIPLYYLSTEVVFNGKKTNMPYNEHDQPDPLSFLAQTKRAGELITLNSSSNNSVIRLIICYSPSFSGKTDIARMALSKVQNGETFTATTDQKINPVYVDHIVNALEKILIHKASGIFHIGAKDCTTPFEFCKKVVKAFHLNEKLILPTTFAKFSKTRSEPRPQHEWLDVNKFSKKFGSSSLHTIDEGVELFKKNFYKK